MGGLLVKPFINGQVYILYLAALFASEVIMTHLRNLESAPSAFQMEL